MVKRQGNTDWAINKTHQLLAGKAAFFPSNMSQPLIKKLKWCRWKITFLTRSSVCHVLFRSPMFVLNCIILWLCQVWAMFSVIPSDFVKLIRTDHLSAWAQVISADWVKKTYLSLPYNKERDEQIYPLTWVTYLVWKQTTVSNSIGTTIVHGCFFRGKKLILESVFDSMRYLIKAHTFYYSPLNGKCLFAPQRNESIWQNMPNIWWFLLAFFFWFFFLQSNLYFDFTENNLQSLSNYYTVMS